MSEMVESNTVPVNVGVDFYKYQHETTFQIVDCFGQEAADDPKERNDRFLEESLELVQSLGYTASEAHQMVQYVFSRKVGEPAQEVGGVMHTLSGLCSAHSLNLINCAQKEHLRFIPLKAKIRAKCVGKPRFYPIVDFDPKKDIYKAVQYLNHIKEGIGSPVGNTLSAFFKRRKVRYVELAIKALTIGFRSGLITETNSDTSHGAKV